MAEEGGFKNLLFGFVFFLLFSIILITIVNTQGAIYGKDVSEVTGGVLNVNTFNESIINVTTSVSEFRESFSKGNIFVALGDVIFTGIFEIAQSMVAIIVTPFTLLSGIMINILGVPIWITDTILALIGLTIIFAIWRLIKVGD
jgi:hypothetical protein